jgi:hypothetical protein
MDGDPKEGYFLILSLFFQGLNWDSFVDEGWE